MRILVFTAAAAVCSAAFADLKIGTVDMLKLVRNHPNYSANKALLESTDKDNQKKVDAIKDEGESLQAEGKKMLEQRSNPRLSEVAKRKIEKDLAALQQKLVGIEQRYRAEAMRARQELQDLEGRMLKATSEDLRKRIDKFATAKGYDLIVDRAAAPFAAARFDVTPELLLDMGVDPKDAKKPDESK